MKIKYFTLKFPNVLALVQLAMIDPPPDLTDKNAFNWVDMNFTCVPSFK